MPFIGEIKGAKSIHKNGTNRYIWASCIDCGKERWVKLKNNKPESLRCRTCNMKQPLPFPKGMIEHPEEGDIRRGTEIGYKYGNKFVWSACTECGQKRWVVVRKGKPGSQLCSHCQRKRVVLALNKKREYLRDKNPNWKGGKYTRSSGYIDIKLPPDDFFRPMADKSGYVLEHRLVMAKHLHRCLLPWEVVHHKNGVKNDNRLQNLELFPSAYKHDLMTKMGNYIKKLEARIKELENEANSRQGIS